LGLFEGVVDEDVLGLFSAAAGVPARFAGVGKEAWAGLLQRLAAVGLLSRLGAGMYRLHPALPAWLTTAWRASVGAGFAAERAAADDALLTAYAQMGNWLFRQIHGGAAELAHGLLDRQRATMGRLLGQALAGGHYTEAQALMEPLDAFWHARGLGIEADGWVDRCCAALEQANGAPPALDSAGGALWLFAVGARAKRGQDRGDLAAAAATYDNIRVSLETSQDEAAKPRLAVTYHLLGSVAQDRGDLVAADEWYRKSLAIWEALSDRPGLAGIYHQLGIMALHRGDLAAADEWYRKSLAILEALGDRPRLAISYHQQGRVAQDRGDLVAADEWYRKSIAIKGALGDRPGLASSYHQLGNVALLRGDLAAAEEWSQKSLAISDALGDRPGLASSYHQLGMVAEGRGDFAAAEEWYQKSLAILDALGDRRGLAISYGQLGLLAERRGEVAAALDWMVRCVSLFSEFPHQATGPAPRHLVRLTGMLGLPALEASWQRCTGAALPPAISQAVAASFKESGA
jgi:tetratricopeptide (TPR) repeat protein